MRSDPPTPSEALARVQETAVTVLRHVYALNADRHDPLVGDDAFTFASHIWRNSWAQIEAALDGDEVWKCVRPAGSFSVSGEGIAIHVYKAASDETVHLESFRLDDPEASLTKQQIAHENQLALDLWGTQEGTHPEGFAGLSNLVVLHAGNSEDGCCGIWIGAPVPVEKVLDSPWEWIVELWAIDRQQDSSGDLRSHTRTHTQLSEPPVVVEVLGETDRSTSRLKTSHRELVEPEIRVELVDDSAGFADTTES